jgi:excisionase family DNA binding protein
MIALTVDNFTKQYGVGRTKVYELLAEGKLTARKLGKRTLIDRAEADSWYHSLPSYQPESAKEMNKIERTTS